MTDTDTMEPHDVILHAEQLIRHDHGLGDPMHSFWSEVADWMNHMQSLARTGSIGRGTVGSPSWPDFNGCLVAARSYINQHEELDNHCQDPQCDGRQITVQFFPCDAGSVLGELRRRVPPETLRPVAHAIVSA